MSNLNQSRLRVFLGVIYNGWVIQGQIYYKNVMKIVSKRVGRKIQKNRRILGGLFIGKMRLHRV